ncbi:hypothetical protein B0H14DRAFT_2971663, partial [Mycena olivaceomarginata]
MLRNLGESMSTAEGLSTWCSTTPYMNAFQPIAASVVEVCRAADLVRVLTTSYPLHPSLLTSDNKVGTKKARILAAHAVTKTEKAINRMAPLPLSPEVVQKLAVLERKLDEIRRSIEKMPARSNNGAKRLMSHLFDREYQRLKTELKRSSKALLESTNDTATDGGISHADGILELASLSIRVATAICEAPALNFLIPAVGIAGVIYDTARSMKSNREAALELAKHSSTVTKCIVDHAARADLSAASNDEALVALNSALEKIRLYLADLQRPRHRIAFFIMANQEKDRTMQLNRGLDKVLMLFTSATVLSTRAEVHSYRHQITTLVRLDSDMKQTLTIMHAGLADITKRENDKPKN